MKLRNINFRQTHSERSAQASYRNFGAKINVNHLKAKARETWTRSRNLIGGKKDGAR